MSIYGALYAAVSGLNANSNAVGIISDNIANANTVGYKETSTNFATLVTQSGSSDLYSPGGVQSAPFYNIAQQGMLQAESSPTDLAMSGGGFFVVNSNAAGGSNGTTSYTRAGNFTVDANGNLVNAAGLYLQGQPLTAAQAAQVAAGNDSVLTTTSPNLLQTVNVSANAGAAQATANVSLVANLPPSGGTQTMNVPIYDSLGIQHQMTLTFTPTGTPDQWSVTAAIPNAGSTSVTIAPGDNIIQFDSNGNLASGTTFNAANAVSINWDPTVTGATSPQAITFNLGTNGTTSGLSQIGGGSTISVGQINQDGVAFGNFAGVSVNKDGIVTANYDNGLQRAIYILPVGTFSAPDKLAPQTGNTYLQTVDSGTAVLRQAGSGSAGSIAPSELENSTVDIAAEFSNLIVSQRAYEANSKVLTTADQMLSTLIQAKQ